jgi:hypothetical protein
MVGMQALGADGVGNREREGIEKKGAHGYAMTWPVLLPSKQKTNKNDTVAMHGCLK